MSFLNFSVLSSQRKLRVFFSQALFDAFCVFEF